MNKILGLFKFKMNDSGMSTDKYRIIREVMSDASNSGKNIDDLVEKINQEYQHTLDAGLQGLLGDLEHECREHLARAGKPSAYKRSSDIGPEQLMHSAIFDSDHVLDLLRDSLWLKEEMDEGSLTGPKVNQFGLDIFNLGVRAKELHFKIAERYAEAGRKVLSGLDKGNRIRKENAESDNEEVKIKMRQLLATGVKDHKLVKTYMKHYGCYSERQLRRIKKDL